MGLFILEGANAVRDAHEAGADLVGVLHDQRIWARQDQLATIQELQHLGVQVQQLPESELARFSDLKSVPPVVGLFRMQPTPEPELPQRTPLVLALDGVADPGNVGTIVRSAAFYGVEELWLGQGSADRYNPKVLRAAMGADWRVRICGPLDLKEVLPGAQAAGGRILAADANGDEPRPNSFGQQVVPAVLVLGNEPHGVSPELLALADARLAIARRGPVDSLNVALACTVLLDRFYRTFDP